MSPPRSLSAAEADALPFVDLAALTAQVERAQDMPMRWVENHLDGLDTEAEHAQPAGAFADQTQLHIRSRIVSFRYRAPAPEFCDGTTCTVPGGETVEQASCPLLLIVGIEAEAWTDDGAVHAQLQGELGRWAPGFEAAIGNAAEETHAHSYQNLHEVVGTLKFTSERAPARGSLLLQVSYTEQGVTGYVIPTLTFETEQRISNCSPLRGEF